MAGRVRRIRGTVPRLPTLLFTHSTANFHHHRTGESGGCCTRVPCVSYAPVWSSWSTPRYFLSFNQSFCSLQINILFKILILKWREIWKFFWIYTFFYFCLQIKKKSVLFYFFRLQKCSNFVGSEIADRLEHFQALCYHKCAHFDTGNFPNSSTKGWSFDYCSSGKHAVAFW